MLHANKNRSKVLRYIGRKRKIILAVAFCFFLFVSNAQITFQKTYGGTSPDIGHCVQQTTDGGYITAGIYFITSNSQVYLIKVDSIGNLLWTSTFGGANYEQGSYVEQTTDGGYIVSGYTRSFGPGLDNIYLIKTNGSGNLIWSKVFGDGQGMARQTMDGGYIVGGFIGGDVTLIKTDGSGNVLWTKFIGDSFYGDGASFIQQTLDGGYILAGWTQGFGSYPDVNIYVVKTDSMGIIQWTKTYGGAGDEYANYIQQTTDHGYVIAGQTASFGLGLEDMYVLKTDSVGNLQWSRTYGGANIDYANSVHQTNDGGYIVAGVTGSFGAGMNDGLLVKIDSMGDLTWSRTMGSTGEEQINSVVQSNDSGFVLTGYTNSFGSGSADVYLIKTDSMGKSYCNERFDTALVTSAATFETTVISDSSLTTLTVVTPTTLIGTGGVATTLCILITGDEEIAIEKNGITVYPNPATDELSVISYELTGNKTLEIYNSIGEKMLEEKFSEQKHAVNVSAFAPGIYFVNVKDEKNNLMVRKFVKM